MGSKPEDTAPEVEGKHHNYIGSAIPWYVRVIWVGFWILCLFYIFRWLIPAFKVEIVTPP